MFNWFRKKQKAPLDTEMRKWFEEYLLFLQHHFPSPPLRKRKIFTPLKSDWPVDWNNPEVAGRDIIDIIAVSMGIETKDILLDFYENPETEIHTGNTTLHIKTEKVPAGLYHGTDFIGRHKISADVRSLRNVGAENRGKFIATLAHEMSHARLMSGIRPDLDDEHLTDLTTLFFGFGIFNANSSFEYKSKSNSWGYESLGYLKQPEWSYALALLAFVRHEKEPEWARHLNTTLRGDLKRDLAWVWANEEDIFILPGDRPMDTTGGRAPGD